MNTWLIAAGLEKVEPKIRGAVVLSAGTKIQQLEREQAKERNRLARQERRVWRYQAAKDIPCLCGCGQLTRAGWVSGHNNRGVGGHSVDWDARRKAKHARYSAKRKASELKPCKCGCGELTQFEWKAGHVGRGENGFAIYKEAARLRKKARDAARNKGALKPCACGCGGVTATKFVWGHNMRKPKC